MIARILFWLFRKPQKVKILIPPELGGGCGISKDHDKYRRVYSKDELTPYVNGRKVRFWKKIRDSDLEMSDEYVPIFYHKRRRIKWHYKQAKNKIVKKPKAFRRR